MCCNRLDRQRERLLGEAKPNIVVLKLQQAWESPGMLVKLSHYVAVPEFSDSVVGWTLKILSIWWALCSQKTVMPTNFFFSKLPFLFGEWLLTKNLSFPHDLDETHCPLSHDSHRLADDSCLLVTKPRTDSPTFFSLSCERLAKIRTLLPWKLAIHKHKLAQLTEVSPDCKTIKNADQSLCSLFSSHCKSLRETNSVVFSSCPITTAWIIFYLSVNFLSWIGLPKFKFPTSTRWCCPGDHTLGIATLMQL